MITIISIVFISSLVCFGISYCYWYQPEWNEKGSPDINPFGDIAPDKMNREILWFVKFYIGRFIWVRFPALRVILKPIFQCVVCMASVYSSGIFWCHFIFTHQQLHTSTFLVWIAVMVATCGLNRIIKTALNL